MARIKIEDLPVLEDLSAKEKKGIFGGEVIPMLIDGSELEGAETTTERFAMDGDGAVDSLNYKITPETKPTTR